MRIAVIAHHHGWFVANPERGFTLAFRHEGQIVWACSIDNFSGEEANHVAALRAYVEDAWPRYRREMAYRRVVVSAETALPMPAMPLIDRQILVRVGDGIAVVAPKDVATMEPAPTGWWPTPVLEPMPDEFSDWRTT